MFKTKRVTGKDHMYQPNLARQTIQYNDTDENENIKDDIDGNDVHRLPHEDLPRGSIPVGSSLACRGSDDGSPRCVRGQGVPGQSSSQRRPSSLKVLGRRPSNLKVLSRKPSSLNLGCLTFQARLVGVDKARPLQERSIHFNFGLFFNS